MKSVCAVVHNVYDSDPRVRRKCEALVAAGHSVDVLSLRATGGKKTYTLNGVNVHTILLQKKRGSLVRYAFEYAVFFLWAMLRIAWMMPSRRYVAVDVNTLPDFLIFAGVPARWMGAKLILDMHEITPEFYMSKYGMKENSWSVRLLTYIEKISFNCADYVLAISDSIRDLLVERGLQRSKSVVIMNAVDEARFIAASSGAAPGPNPRSFVMMYHGTLTPVYGLEIAIEAFRIAHVDMPESELWILGSGPEQPRLAKMVKDYGLTGRIKLVGQVPSTEIPIWLKKCDAGVLPIRRDVFLEFAFPNKLPEFVVMGKPVLMARLKTIRHYFSEDALAFFEPNSPEALAEQMIRLYSDRALCGELAARARVEYKPLRWDVMKQRYLNLIADIAQSEPYIPEESNTAETVAVGR